MGEAGGPTGTEDAMVSLEDLIRVFNGPELLSLLDLVAEKFNPAMPRITSLHSTRLDPPADCPGNLLPADKLGTFLSDAYNPRLRVRCAALFVVGIVTPVCR